MRSPTERSRILSGAVKSVFLVKAHPHTFLPQHLVRMLEKVGFQNIQTIGVPGLTRKFVGSSFRPAFIGAKHSENMSNNAPVSS